MRWIRGLSIRMRITIGTLIVALLVSAIAGVLLRLNVQSIVRATTVQLLNGDSARFEAAIRRAPSDPQVSAGEGQLVALVDPRGAVTLSNLPDFLRDRITTLERQDDDPRQISSRSADYLVRREGVKTTAGTWQIIVARNLASGNLVVDQLGVTLIVGSLALFLVFGVASWLLSGFALRPVSRMRREAERLAADKSFGSLPVGPARDELAALATTLNDLIDRNRQTLERERQLLSDASHELRTPLAVLIAQLDEAADSQGDHTSVDSVINGARSTARRLSHLATNLLELSQLDAGLASASSTWASLSRELAVSIDTARVLAEPQGIGVDFDIADTSEERTYPVSAVNFGRVIDNLLANAVAMSASAALIHVDLAPSATGLVLTVRDHGPGMPESFIPVAFDRFTRPDVARGRTTGGSGLGLAIVAAIVAAAGGRVSLENTPPGLTVTVSIPYERERTASSD